MMFKNGSAEIAQTPARKKGLWQGIQRLLPAFGVNGKETRTNSGGDGPALPVYLRPCVISVMNQKGGCGKTTTVVNLSAALAAKGYRVLVMDMDPQGHATLGLGVQLEEFRRSIYEMITTTSTHFGDVVRETAVRRLDVVPSCMKLSAAQIELANTPHGESALKRSLRGEEKNYDFILIDCPPTLNMLTLNALCYSKKVLIPVQTHYYPLEGMKELFRTIHAVRKRFNPNLEILGILATLFDRRVSIAVEMLDALREHFKSQMFRTIINTSVKLIEAPMVREPVVSYAPQSAAANEFNDLAGEVIEFITRSR